MYINDFQTSNEYRLHQVLHTLKSVHGMEFDFDKNTIDDLESLRESSEIVKNSIISESKFNTYNSNPEYAKHMLIMEAVRLYLTEIAPKRRRAVKEGMEMETDGMQHTVSGIITGEDEELDEMNPAQTPIAPKTPPTSPGMLNVQKGGDLKTRKTIPANQATLANLQRQGYQIVADDVSEDSAQETPSELSALMKKYGVEPTVDEGNLFSKELDDARKRRQKTFKVDGKTYPVQNAESVGIGEAKASKPNYAKLAKEHSRAADAAFDSNDESDFIKHTDLSMYYRIKSGHKAPSVVVDVPKFMQHVERRYHVEKLDESQNVKEAALDHDNYQASMARSELYRNTKYAMDMLRIIKPEDEIQPWIAAGLTKAANYLDKIYHYMDYYTNFEPQQLPEDEDVDPETRDMALGETSGSIARQNLMLIVEYSTKLFDIIKPGDKLEGWVAMKLTTASDAVSSSKHYLDYVQFEKHASDMLGDVATMAEEGSKMRKKTVKESVGQLLMGIMLSEDQDLAQAQTLLAAKALSDDLQDMAEKVAKMSVEDLMPLVDTMKEQFGPEAAEGYNAAMKQSLEILLKTTTDAKDASDNAILQLQGGGVPAATTDIEAPELEAPEIPGGEEDEFKATDAAAGPKEEPLGRAKKDESVKSNGKALNEKWGTEMKTKEKDKGMWDGWTVAELKSEKAKLMKKETRSAAEQKKVKQIDFAIRAKQKGKGKWGEIKKESVNEGAISNTIRVLVALGLGAYALNSLSNKDLMDMPLAKAMSVAASKGDKNAAEELRKINLYVEAGDWEKLRQLKDTYLDVKEASMSEAKKSKKNPHAIGMYQAKKEAGLDPKKPAHDLPKKIITRAHDIARSIEKGDKVSESSGNGLNEWINANKDKFVNRYGKEKGMSMLYGRAWLKHGLVSDAYKQAESMFESASSNLGKLEKTFAAHKKAYSRMVNEGTVIDPLNMGYGLEGEVMLEKMDEMKTLMTKLGEMMRDEVRKGVSNMLMAEQDAEKVRKLSRIKESNPYGVAWKDTSGNRMNKFFENESLRDYWMQLNSEQLSEHMLINPEHFDQKISKISDKKAR